MSAKLAVLFICCAAVQAQYQFSPTSFYGGNLGNEGSQGSGGQGGNSGSGYNQGQGSLGYFGAYGSQGQESLGNFGNYGGQGNQGGSGGNQGSSFGRQGGSGQNYFGYWARNLALYGNDGFNPGDFGGSQGQGSSAQGRNNNNQGFAFGLGMGNQGSGGQGFGMQGSGSQGNGNQGYATSYSNGQYSEAINFPYTRPAMVIAHIPQQITSTVPVVQTNEEPYDHNPVYNFAYSVSDAHTGDHKSQEESRHGDSVRGQYSLIEPDGSQRTVNYAVEPHSGFNALVQRTQVRH